MPNMPTDPVSNRLMLEVHFYQPWNFCGEDKRRILGQYGILQGSPYNNQANIDGTNRNSTWGDESYMNTLFGKLKSQYVDKGLPYHIGRVRSHTQRQSEEHQLLGDTTKVANIMTRKLWNMARTTEWYHSIGITVAQTVAIRIFALRPQFVLNHRPICDGRTKRRCRERKISILKKGPDNRKEVINRYKFVLGY